MKNEILELLKKYHPGFISGEEISKALHVSRTAIWKHMQSLKDDGYVIDSLPRKGYKLVKVPDRMYPQEILNNLKTKYIGQNIFYFDRTTSTNDVAKALANEGINEGAIVVAEAQEKGKGRLGRNWSSPHGMGIWFSVILRPAISPVEAPKYTILAGVAVANAILRYPGIETGIKWPNDILIGGKKVCGILTEMNAEVDTVNYIVIGIGLNVNTSNKSFPADLRDSATSILEQTGQKVNRVKLLQKILEELEQLNKKFISGAFDQILARWKALSVTINSPVKVTTLKESFSGKAVDIDHDGALIVQLANGQETKVLAGDVTLSKKR